MSSSNTRPGPSLPAHLIPLRLSSKLHDLPTYLSAIETSKKRKVSTQSRLSTSTSIPDFLDLKLKDAQDDAADFSKLYDIAQESFQSKTINHADYNQLINELEKQREEKDSEVSAIKRQRKIIVEDLEDQMLHGMNFSKAEKEYAHLMVKCISQASCKMKASTVNRSNFRANVLEHLQASRIEAIKNTEELWCHVLGKWLPKKYVKTAHLVPASLSGPEISYAFGVEKLNLEDGRIGMHLKLYNGKMHY
jgi:hypothetical protein